MTKMAKVWHNAERGGWFYMLDMRDPVGPFETWGTAIVECRRVAGVKTVLKARDLSRVELERIVDTAQTMLWATEIDGVDFWDADTQWTWERVEEIAAAMIRAGLRPPYSSDAEDAA